MDKGEEFVRKHKSLLICIGIILISVILFIIYYFSIKAFTTGEIKFVSIINDTQIPYSCNLGALDTCKCNNYTYNDYEMSSVFDVPGCNGYFKYIADQKENNNRDLTLFLVLFSTFGVFLLCVGFWNSWFSLIAYCYNYYYKRTYTIQNQDQNVINDTLETNN